MLGILPMNIAFFALPMQLAGSAPLPSEPLTEHLAFHGTELFITQKFISVFALLFGVGLFLMQERAVAAGQSNSELVVVRLLVLWGFGLLHIALLWYGDVLGLYAPLGLMVFWAWRTRPRRLVIIAVGLIVVSWLTVPLQREFDFFEEPTVAQVELVDWVHRDDSIDWDGIGSPATDMRVFGSGSFGEITGVRAICGLFGWIFGGLVYGPRLIGLMLIGMAWAQLGWILHPRQHARPFQRLVVWGLAVGAPVSVLGSWLRWQGDDRLADVAHYLGSLGLAAAIVGVVGRLMASGREDRMWVKALSAVGRTAFSNYILQSVVATTLFYSYGLGWFGERSRLELLGVVAAIWVFEVAVSLAWLRKFPMGPLEWLWRSITYRWAT